MNKNKDYLIIKSLEKLEFENVRIGDTGIILMGAPEGALIPSGEGMFDIHEMKHLCGKPWVFRYEQGRGPYEYDIDGHGITEDMVEKYINYEDNPEYYL